MDDLERAVTDLENKGEQWVGGGHTDRRIVPALMLLSKAVIRLDRSSTFLARVNLGLGIVVILIGVLQVVLMLRGH